MKRTLPVYTTVFLACSFGAWAQSGSDSSKMSDSKMSSMSAKKGGGMDAKFAKEAADGGMAEVKLGQLAADKGSSDFVKSFGKKMVDDHGKANDELKAAAGKNSITLPTDVSAKNQALYDRLSKLSGTAFDSAYIAAMKKDHAQDIAAFQKEASAGKNPDIKDFASKTLPVVQGHKQMLDSQKMM